MSARHASDEPTETELSEGLQAVEDAGNAGADGLDVIREAAENAAVDDTEETSESVAKATGTQLWSAARNLHYIGEDPRRYDLHALALKVAEEEPRTLHHFGKLARSYKN